MSNGNNRAILPARLPRGFADREAADIRITETMLRTIREVYERYGFEPVETPFVEYTEALGKFLPDQDRPNEGVFSFQDEDEGWLSLRYDLTAPLARYVAQNYDALPKPYRSYRAGWVFRNEKPGPGRFRQFMQFDADTVGASSVAADAEICMMAADTLEALGIPHGQYVIKVNNRKVLDGVMEAIGLAGEENAGRRLTALRAIDKLDRLGVEGVRALLGEGRRDESGDFTPGTGLDAKSINLVVSVFGFGMVLTSPASAQEAQERPRDVITFEGSDGEWYRKVTFQSVFETLTSVRKRLGSETSKFDEGVKELQEIASLAAASGYDDGRIRIDPSVVRGLEYYTGPVFEAELLFETVNEKGEPARFGSVGGGGRYDGLVGRFRAEDVPATGFSIGVSRLASALKLTGRLGASEAPGPVVVTVMDRERMADYQAMTARLRAAGIRAEMYLGSSGMKAQLKYADRRGAPCAVIQGSQERENGKVQIKDLALGKELSRQVADNETWRAERPAQFEADESRLAEAITDLLRRQAGT